MRSVRVCFDLGKSSFFFIFALPPCDGVVVMMMPPNDLSGAGVLIRTIEKGDCTTYPANGDSCLVRFGIVDVAFAASLLITAPSHILLASFFFPPRFTTRHDSKEARCLTAPSNGTCRSSLSWATIKSCMGGRPLFCISRWEA
jgi:hypothetical protein